jgi:small-conductance mechanosensitive channel
MLLTWSDVLRTSFQDLWMGVVSFVPNLVVAIIIFLAGWFLAAFLGKVIAQAIKAVKLDKALQATGLEKTLENAGFKLDSGAFLGGLVKWFVIIVVLVATLQVLGLTQVNEFLSGVVLSYLPNVIVAALILIVATILADAVQKIVSGSAKAAGVTSSGFLGAVAKWAIWIFAILAALYQLGVAGVFAQTLFTGIIAMLVIAGGLSFGLGGKEMAAKALDKMADELQRKG